MRHNNVSGTILGSAVYVRGGQKPLLAADTSRARAPVAAVA